MNSSRLVPIREGMFTTPLCALDQVRLVGSRCNNCGETMFGETSSCGHCGSEDMKVVPLSNRGKLWTYTIVRHRPPGQYRGPEPFVPLPVGLVELPDGVRVLSVLDCPIDDVRIGMDLELVVFNLYQDEEGNDVVAFKFRPV